MYYGFQPLFDALIDETMPQSQRPYALNILNQVVQVSVDYLTGYYTGAPEVKLVKDRLKALETDLKDLDSSPYTQKQRNVDANEIYPENIRSFLVQFFEHTLDSKVNVPNYVIGCACGSSEIAMPLASLLDVDVDFIRRSWQRGDDAPKIITEQEHQIKGSCARKSVICIEDYVCSGKSLLKVMNKVKSYKPKEIIGASTNFSAEGNHLQVSVNNPSFKIFKLRYEN